MGHIFTAPVRSNSPFRSPLRDVWPPLAIATDGLGHNPGGLPPVLECSSACWRCTEKTARGNWSKRVRVEPSGFVPVADIPHVSFQYRLAAVGQNEYSLAEVGQACFCRREQSCRNCVISAFQVAADIVQNGDPEFVEKIPVCPFVGTLQFPPGPRILGLVDPLADGVEVGEEIGPVLDGVGAGEAFDVFKEDQTGPAKRDSGGDVGVEVALVFGAFSFACGGKGLAGESRSEDVHLSAKLPEWEGDKIRPDRSCIQASLFHFRNQIGHGKAFDLAISDCPQAFDDSMESEINAAVSGTKGEVCNCRGRIHMVHGLMYFWVWLLTDALGLVRLLVMPARKCFMSSRTS